MESNIGRSENQKPKSRVVVFRCSDQAYSDIMNMIRSFPDIYIVYTKSSYMKLKVIEEDF